MAYDSILDDIKTCGEMGIPGRVPVFAITGEFDVRVSGVTYYDYAHDPQIMADVQIEMAKRFDYDWTFLIPDDYMEIEPLGVKTTIQDKASAAAIEHIPATQQAVDKLMTGDPYVTGRMPAMLKALAKLRSTLSDRLCITGNVAGPFTSCGLLFGPDATLMLPFDNESLLLRVIDFFVDLQICWGKAQIESGAHAIWLGDCMAGSAFISPDFFTRYALTPAQTVCQALKDAGAFVFYHAGESQMSHLELMAKVEPTALNVGEQADLSQVKKMLGRDICLMGNIDGLKTLGKGSFDEVRQETSRIMNTGKANGGYIFNSGEGMAYNTPDPNIITMFKTAREHSQI